MSVQCRYIIEVGEEKDGIYTFSEERCFFLNTISVADFLDRNGSLVKRSEVFDDEDGFGANSNYIVEIEVDKDIIEAVWEDILEDYACWRFDTDFAKDLKQLKNALWSGFGCKMYFAIE